MTGEELQAIKQLVWNEAYEAGRIKAMKFYLILGIAIGVSVVLILHYARIL